MAIPSQVKNLTAQQADGNVLLKWDPIIFPASESASYYVIRRNTAPYYLGGGNQDNFTAPMSATEYLDVGVPLGQKYYYQIAGLDGDSEEEGQYSSAAIAVAAPPSEMSLYELRLRSQQTADRVGSQFVTDSEWNAFIRLAMYELYDLLIGSYEDYFATAQVTITTSGSQQYYPLPNGVSNYIDGSYNTINSFIFYGTLGESITATVGDVLLNNGYQFTVTASGVGQFGDDVITATGTGVPTPSGVLSNQTQESQIEFSRYQFGSSAGSIGANSEIGRPFPAFYKMVGVDLAVNTSTVNPAWVSLKKYNFIDRNKYVYPNSTSTIYGVYNQAYRVMGDQIQLIPVPAGNQTIRLWYTPRLPALLQDSDLTTIGYSGWLRYAIVRAAKYALDKEEGSDTSKLTEEIVFLKQRIEQMASNRDQGMPDTISETRRDGVYGGNSGPGWPNAGW